MAAMFTPSYAYIPGRTVRHPEGTFDHIRDTARPGMSPDALARTVAFRTGLSYLDSGYFWEAHEVLEPVWMALPERGEDRQVVQALIQLANASLKLRMDRPKAARRLCEIVRGHLGNCTAPQVMTLEIQSLLVAVESLEAQLN